MRFVAIDLETANPRMSSICQVGVVTFEGGKEVGAEAWLVNRNHSLLLGRETGSNAGIDLLGCAPGSFGSSVLAIPLAP